MSDDQAVERAALVLLEKAISLEPEERAGWLDSSGENPQAIDRCRVLLEAFDRAEGQFATGAALYDAGAVQAPEKLGAYRILELIGQGGMGAVFRAVRDAGDFEHEAAVKLIRNGLLSDAAVDRFERERQILARLVHPNIARLLDGGATEDGSPFIVMEYVPGVPIDRWVEEHGLGLTERLRIFLQVCSAVEYAHQNLVVHRDLTPANVLVGSDGEPKLIDFGIARPQDEGMQPAQAVDGAVEFSMTPGFSAPERYAGAPTTTLGDIYSMGKLLQVLLGDWSGDPDLAAIVAKASATDPEDRYRTVGMLAQDLRRYLAGRAVEARGNSRRYRMGKFLKRNRRAVFASAAGLALLLAALVGTSLAYAGAERARLAEAERFRQVRELANFMLFDLNDRLERVAGTTETRAALVVQARSYLESLARTPNASPDLTRDIASGFVRLALVQGVSGHPNIGEHASAKKSLDEAERLLLSLGTPGDPGVAAPLARARAYRSLILLHSESDPKGAAGQIQAGLAALDAVAPERRDWPWLEARSMVRRSQLESADLAGETEELERLSQLLLAELDSWPQAHRDTPRGRIDRAIATQYLATARYNASRLPEALTHFAEADALYSALEREVPNDPIVLYWRGWNAYYGYAVAGTLGRDAEAAALLAQARNAADRLLAIEANESIVTFVERLREAQAEHYVNQGRHAEAIALQREIVEARRAAIGPTRRSGGLSDLAYGYAILGTIARRASDRELACDSWEQAEDLMAEVDGRGDLYGFLGELRSGVLANLKRCAAGAPVTAFKPLT